MNFANTTLGELLSHSNQIIKRNALSCLKQLQRERDAQVDHVLCGDCKHELVKPITIAGIVRKDIPVYCDDCLDERRDYREE